MALAPPHLVLRTAVLATGAQIQVDALLDIASLGGTALKDRIAYFEPSFRVLDRCREFELMIHCFS